MNKISLVCYLFFLSTFNSVVFADTEQEELDRKMYIAVATQDYEKFKEYLFSGGEPNAITEKPWYPSSSLCEATRKGNEKYLDLIINSMEADEVLKGVSSTKNAVNCAIQYKNIEAFKKFISIGLDVTAVVDPDLPENTHRTWFDIAWRKRKSEIMWYIIQRSQPTEIQKSRINRSLQKFGGFEGSEDVQYFEKIANWLIEQGYDVNLAPPAPDPRTIKR